jgi:4-hydroxy-2-oxoheptanedioate aldolase
MRGKRVKDKLRAGQPVFLTGVTFYAPRLIEMLARSGVDLITLDGEHGPLSERDCEDMIRAADLYDVPVQIRVPTNEPHVILRYLDIGTSSIMVPHVTTRDDAERAVKAIKYPPEGARSYFSTRGAERLGVGPVEYMRRANEETMVLALFEDAAGVEEIKAICQVEGVDAMYVGTFDLAASMGHAGQPFHDEVQTIVERVLQTCFAHKMPVGTVPRDRADLAKLVERGCQIVPLGTIQWGIEATKAAIAEISALKRGDR